MVLDRGEGLGGVAACGCFCWDPGMAGVEVTMDEEETAVGIVSSL